MELNHTTRIKEQNQKPAGSKRKRQRERDRERNRQRERQNQMNKDENELGVVRYLCERQYFVICGLWNI